MGFELDDRVDADRTDNEAAMESDKSRRRS